MSISNNLAAANRVIPPGNTIANTTAKSYFASKITIPAGYTQPDMIWHLRAIGTYGSAAVAAAATLRLEANRGVMLAISAPLVPATLITREQWEMDLVITVASLGSAGSIIANGRAGASLAAAGSITLRPMMGGLITGINFDVATDLEISLQMGALGVLNAWTLEQMIWEEKRAQ